MRYSWYGQMSPGQILLGQMSLLQIESVQDGPNNIYLKFGQNGASNSWDIADIEFPVGGGGWWVGGVKSFSCKTQT